MTSHSLASYNLAILTGVVGIVGVLCLCGKRSSNLGGAREGPSQVAREVMESKPWDVQYQSKEPNVPERWQNLGRWLDEKYLDKAMEKGWADPYKQLPPISQYYHRPRIPAWTLCGWHHKDNDLNYKITQLKNKIRHAEYQMWILNKHKPMSPEENRKEWGMFARNGDPAESRKKEVQRLSNQVENWRIKMQSHQQELHDFKQYLKNEWRPLSEVSSNGKDRPKWRYPSRTKMWDDQDAMCMRSTPKDFEFKMKEFSRKIQFKLLRAYYWLNPGKNEQS